MYWEEYVLAAYFGRIYILWSANKLPRKIHRWGRQNNAVLKILWSALRSTLANGDMKFKHWYAALCCKLGFCTVSGEFSRLSVTKIVETWKIFHNYPNTNLKRQKGKKDPLSLCFLPPLAPTIHIFATRVIGWLHIPWICS